MIKKEQPLPSLITSCVSVILHVLLVAFFWGFLFVCSNKDFLISKCFPCTPSQKFWKIGPYSDALECNFPERRILTSEQKSKLTVDVSSKTNVNSNL